MGGSRIVVGLLLFDPGMKMLVIPSPEDVPEVGRKAGMLSIPSSVFDVPVTGSDPSVWGVIATRHGIVHRQVEIIGSGPVPGSDAAYVVGAFCAGASGGSGIPQGGAWISIGDLMDRETCPITLPAVRAGIRSGHFAQVSDWIAKEW